MVAFKTKSKKLILINTKATSELSYTIRFQNTGNDTAFTVQVFDTLTSTVDPNTFKMVAASHGYQLDFLGGNVIRWTFNNILLTPQSVNDSLSQGFVQFKINAILPTCACPFTVENNAAIYFDFNAPIITNTTQTNFTYSGITSAQTLSIKTYPNPTKDNFTIELEGEADFSLMDVTGKVLMNNKIQDKSTIELNYPAGIYFYKIQQGDKIATGKVVKM